VFKKSKFIVSVILVMLWLMVCQICGDIPTAFAESVYVPGYGWSTSDYYSEIYNDTDDSTNAQVFWDKRYSVVPVWDYYAKDFNSDKMKEIYDGSPDFEETLYRIKIGNSEEFFKTYTDLRGIGHGEKFLSMYTDQLYNFSIGDPNDSEISKLTSMSETFLNHNWTFSYLELLYHPYSGRCWKHNGIDHIKQDTVMVRISNSSTMIDKDMMFNIMYLAYHLGINGYFKNDNSTYYNPVQFIRNCYTIWPEIAENVDYTILTEAAKYLTELNPYVDMSDDGTSNPIGGVSAG